MSSSHAAAAGANDHPVARRIRQPGPKRILSCDGGGLRGVVTLAFLKRMETILAEHYGTGADFRLRDHFDMIGGTSTGSIIATALALGWPVDRLRAAYDELGWGIMRRRAWRRGIFGSRFSGKAIDEGFHRQLGDATLGSRDITCALVIVTKRLDTGSVWTLHNNPFGLYYDRPQNVSSVPNKDIPLHRIVRASSAAPTYVDPEFIEVVKGTVGFFIDGAASPFGSPAVLLFLVATTPSYGYCWEMGERTLHLTSVGTGWRRTVHSGRLLRWLPSALMGTMALQSMIGDCSRFGHMMLQSLSAVTIPWVVDREAGALDHEKPAGRRLLSYTRYELPLDAEWLATQVGKRLTEKELDILGQIDNPEGMNTLYELASAAAERLVRPDLLIPAKSHAATRKHDTVSRGHGRA